MLSKCDQLNLGTFHIFHTLDNFAIQIGKRMCCHGDGLTMSIISLIIPSVLFHRFKVDFQYIILLVCGDNSIDFSFICNTCVVNGYCNGGVKSMSMCS